MLRNSHALYNAIVSATLPDGQKQFLSQKMKEVAVNLIPDGTIAPAIFRPHPHHLGVYFAHPVTIRALRKDIFLAGDNFEFLQQDHRCEGCKRMIDLQFWHFCPYCEKHFSEK